MALLGNDGRGYELARLLESTGVWREWLGDSTYATFVHFLSSHLAWDSFMRVDDSKSRAQIQLQLRCRALLFDKATVTLFLRSHSTNAANNNSSSSPLPVSKLNPNYLQLHGDDVYFTLDGSSQAAAAAPNTAPSKSKSSFRYAESEYDSLSQRYRNEELPETWYNQFIEKYRLKRPYNLCFGDRESEKRTPEEMTTYLRLLEKHKRRRVAFQEDQYMGYGNSCLDGNNSADEDVPFFPETMFCMNCVPESPLPLTARVWDKKAIEFYGVLDTLPQVSTRNPVMIERLGIRPEYLNMEQGGNVNRGKNPKKQLSQEQASQISRKVIARLLTGVGFEGAMEAPVEVFSQFLSCHISKLGRNLKVLTDNYRKQCSAIELIKMFLQTSGYSNFGTLAELVKDSTRNLVQQTQQQMHAMQSQLQPQHQNALRMAQQLHMTRQMHPQMQQIHPQNLSFQQQQHLERMLRCHPSTPRPVMDMGDKDRPLVQVKLENPSEMPMDSTAFNPINTRQQQMQFRQQQLAAMSSMHSQSNNQFRQLMSSQIPQSPSMSGVVRAPPVKVEGFSELMGGGDTTLKHEAEENKLTSPTTTK